MRPDTLPIPDHVRNFVHYDQTSSTGLRRSVDVLRKDGSKTRWKAGDEIGSIRFNHRGRPQAMAAFVCGRHYLVHRIIWWLHHGHLDPSDMLDHIDGNPFNNRIENLRLASATENAWNRRGAGGKTGVKGVFMTAEGNYIARCRANGVIAYLGTFKSLDAAKAAMQKLREEKHGQFAKHE